MASYRRETPRHETAVVAVAPSGFEVRVDGRSPVTPAGRRLILPTRALAAMVASEWRERAVTNPWTSLLATRLAYGALDAGQAQITSWSEAIANFAETDLLCYPADSPRELADRQRAIWAAARRRIEALWGVRFRLGAAVAPVRQEASVAEAAGAWAAGLDPFTLVAVDATARLFGSAILAAALAEGMLDADAAFAAATVDETFQQQTWGIDAEAAARQEALCGEARLIGRFLRALCAS